MKRLIKSVVASIAIAFGMQSAMATENQVINFLDFDSLLSYETQECAYKPGLPDNQNPEDGESVRYWVDSNGESFAETAESIGTVKPYGTIEEGATPVEAYLELDTDAPVYRRIGVGQDNATLAYDMGAVYIDTRVQFTPADEDTESVEGSDDDKLIIWMREKNIESTDPVANPPSTNLLITCGSSAGPRTYVVNEINDKPWEANKWYRIVIKSGKTLTKDGQPGFLVYISDDANLDDVSKLTKVSATYTEIQEPAVTVDETEGETTTDGEASGDETTEEEQTPIVVTETIEVFKSLISNGDNVDKISQVGYTGMGKIDEVSVTTNDPCPDVKYFNLTWDANIASLSYTVGDGEAVELGTEDLALGAKTIELPAEGGTITLTYTPINGFTADGAGQNCTVEGGVITVAQADLNPSFAITTKANNFFVGETPYETFDAALAAVLTAGEGVIKLGNNITLDPSTTQAENTGLFGQMLLEGEGGDIVLDLNGKTLTTEILEQDSDCPGTIVVLGINLTIINTADEVGTISTSDADLPAINVADGSLMIYGDKIKIDGVIIPDTDDEIVLAGGSYKSGNSEVFDLAAFVAEGYSYSYADGYWTVALGGGEEPDPDQPETVTYTITYVTGNDSVVDAKNITVAAAGTAYTITAEDLPVLTADGYVFGGWKMKIDDTDTAVEVGTIITGSVELTAVWSIKPYTITYVNGEEVSTATVTPTVAKGEVTLTENELKVPEAKDGYVFDGWKLGGTLVEANKTTISGDETLTAVWSIKPYTITYVNKRGASNPPSKTVTPTTANGEYKLTDAELESFTMTGYIFAGYKNESGNIVKKGDVIAGDVTLTLAWNIKITYETAQGVAPEAIYKDVTDTGVYSITADDMPTLAKVEGYTFSHWTYTNGGVVSVGNNITQNTTLVAVWNAVAPVDPWAPEADTDAAAAEAAKDIFGEDSAVATEITTAKQYTELVSYIKTVKGDKVEPDTLTTAEKTYILDSLALGAEELLTAEPNVELKEVVADTAPEAAPGDWKFNVKVTQGDVATAIKVAKDNVKALVKICTDLTQGNWDKPADANIEAAEGSNNEISVKIKFGNAKSGFIKIKK